MNQKRHALNCGESSFVTSRWVKCLFPMALLLTTGSVYGQAAAQPSPPIVVRDSNKVVLAHKETVSFVGSEWKLDFYRNLGYNAGLSGNYTFLVAEPLDNPGAEAPLWVYLHGGGIGYFDEQGVYHATGNQTQDTWNHEETFEGLRKIGLRPIIDKNGQPIDNTVPVSLELFDFSAHSHQRLEELNLLGGPTGYLEREVLRVDRQTRGSCAQTEYLECLVLFGRIRAGLRVGHRSKPVPRAGSAKASASCRCLSR